MVTSNIQLDDVATEIYNVLADEEIPLIYVEEVFNRAHQIVMLETKVGKKEQEKE